MKKAFTLIELIFTIVIIGVLASVAVPKFSGLSDNSKIASELSTASSVQSAIDACHGEWIINEGTFTCGKDIDGSNDLTEQGYPKNDKLGESDASPLNKLLKGSTGKDWSKNNDHYKGPASKTKCTDISPHKKPCEHTYWLYDETDGSFVLTSDD